MIVAACPHCDRQRIVVNPNTPQARYRTHVTKDTAGRATRCPGSLQPLPALTRTKEA